MIDLTQFEGHTPGPWGTGFGKCGEHTAMCVVPEDGASVVAAMYPHGLSEPNLALMCAAPDLLAEVKVLMKQIIIFREYIADGCIIETCNPGETCDTCTKNPVFASVSRVGRE